MNSLAVEAATAVVFADLSHIFEAERPVIVAIGFMDGEGVGLDALDVAVQLFALVQVYCHPASEGKVAELVADFFGRQARVEPLVEQWRTGGSRESAARRSKSETTDFSPF